MCRSTRSTTKQMTRDAFLGRDTSSTGRKKHHEVIRSRVQSSFLMWCVQAFRLEQAGDVGARRAFHAPTHTLSFVFLLLILVINEQNGQGGGSSYNEPPVFNPGDNVR